MDKRHCTLGANPLRGWEGNVGDYYLNTENYNLYRCTTSGTSSTALWTYVGNIKGEDANISANTYTIEYSLSTSPSEYLFPIETINYTEEDDFGSIDNDPIHPHGQEIWTQRPSVDFISRRMVQRTLCVAEAQDHRCKWRGDLW